MKNIKHYGDYTDSELENMNPIDLIKIIKESQNDDNFIIMTDSYKMTHHLLVPEGLEEVYSYMEPRGGEMPYTILFGLQYYIKKYLSGIRITKEKIEQARIKNKLHFGFDCFDDTMWNYILNNHNGRLPLEIKAIPEGTPISVRNIILSIRNTDKKCASLTNITETLLMKLWATNTVATYGRMMKTLMLKYHNITSDLPKELVDFMHHDFGYRGTSSEETARLMGASGLISFKGTDTLGAISMLDTFYDEKMGGFSVIASEHMIQTSYGGREKEFEGYQRIIRRVKEKCQNIDTPSKTIILSLVSDTYNIYNVCNTILPKLKDEWIGWKNDNGCEIKIVIRPDSGDPINVLFGHNGDDIDYFELVSDVAKDMDINLEESGKLVSGGIFNILFDKFGFSENSKGFKVLHTQIGLLQGDGVSYDLVKKIYPIMVDKKIDIMNLVLGSGGKYLQLHDRDEQKYAIKATHVIVNGIGIDIQKDPITDLGKKSKKGYLKLVKTGESYKDYLTVPDNEENKIYDDVLETIFLNGDLIKELTFDEIRNNSKILEEEYIC